MKYSVEALEFLKQKANITYDEAVELLKKHQGDAALAIVELEKEGKLKPAESNNKNIKDKKSGGQFKRLLKKSMAHRLVIKKDTMVVANISWLFVFISIFTAPWLVAFAFIASMVLGYKYSCVNWKMCGEEIKETVNSAVNNIKDFTSKIMEEEPLDKSNVDDKMASEIIIE